MIKWKSYKLKAIQNNSPELSGALLNDNFHKNAPDITENRPNNFAVFLPQGSLLQATRVLRLEVLRATTHEWKILRTKTQLDGKCQNREACG